jgi:hypothetical protein
MHCPNSKNREPKLGCFDLLDKKNLPSSTTEVRRPKKDQKVEKRQR